RRRADEREKPPVGLGPEVVWGDQAVPPLLRTFLTQSPPTLGAGQPAALFPDGRADRAPGRGPRPVRGLLGGKDPTGRLLRNRYGVPGRRARGLIPLLLDVRRDGDDLRPRQSGFARRVGRRKLGPVPVKAQLLELLPDQAQVPDAEGAVGGAG